jgi:hypothetical protein
MTASLPEAQILDNSLFRALVLQTKAISRSLLGLDAPFEIVESVSLQVSNLAVREFLRADLQRRSGELAEELLIKGELWRRHLCGTISYHSLCGSLLNTRFTYREVGVRNGPTIVPLELAAGLVERQPQPWPTPGAPWRVGAIRRSSSFATRDKSASLNLKRRSHGS